MNHFMSFTRSELIKFFVTHFTFKRFDIGMNSFMNFQTTKLIAQFSTINTFKRFWIKMSGLMVFEGIWVSKFLSAKIAFQCFFTNMNTFLVYCQRFQMFEFLIASLTFIGLSFWMCQFMPFQITRWFEWLLTLPTLMWSFTWSFKSARLLNLNILNITIGTSNFFTFSWTVEKCCFNPFLFHSFSFNSHLTVTVHRYLVYVI